MQRSGESEISKDQQLKHLIETIMQSLSGPDKKTLISVLKGKIQPPNTLIFQSASELRQLNPVLANELIGVLKISLSPAYTKYARQSATNDYELCHYLSLLWLRLHLQLPGSLVTGTRFNKSDFYTHTALQFIPALGRPVTPGDQARIFVLFLSAKKIFCC